MWIKKCSFQSSRYVRASLLIESANKRIQQDNTLESSSYTLKSPFIRGLYGLCVSHASLVRPVVIPHTSRSRGTFRRRRRSPTPPNEPPRSAADQNIRIHALLRGKHDFSISDHSRLSKIPTLHCVIKIIQNLRTKWKCGDEFFIRILYLWARNWNNVPLWREREIYYGFDTLSTYHTNIYSNKYGYVRNGLDY